MYEASTKSSHCGLCASRASGDALLEEKVINQEERSKKDSVLTRTFNLLKGLNYLVCSPWQPEPVEGMATFSRGERFIRVHSRIRRSFLSLFGIHGAVYQTQVNTVGAAQSGRFSTVLFPPCRTHAFCASSENCVTVYQWLCFAHCAGHIPQCSPG